MKYLYTFILTASITLSYAQGEKGGNTITNSPKIHTTDLISLTVPTIYEGDIKYLQSNGTMTVIDVDSVTHDSTLLASLSKIESTVTVYKKNAGGSITLLGNEVSSKNETYIVIYDFVQSQAFEVDDNDNLVKVVGIGVRMVATVRTKKRKLNLTDIFKIGLSASKGEVSGSLEVKTIGVNSQKINQAIPVTTDLSQASISAALQSVATIKSHIYDSDTDITPYYIGFTIPISTNANEIDDSIRQLGL